MTKFVVGLSFNANRHFICLIKKNRPSWMAGYYNGVGGKIEGDETPLQCMVREYEEETGLKTFPHEWTQVSFLKYENGNSVHFFKRFNDDIINARTVTDEKIVIASMLDIKGGEYKLFGDLMYHINLALSDFFSYD